jgi:hypothetical protein
MWYAVAILMVVWLVLTFIFHFSGVVHMLLLAAISVAGVQLLADSKTRYHRNH